MDWLARNLGAIIFVLMIIAIAPIAILFHPQESEIGARSYTDVVTKQAEEPCLTPMVLKTFEDDGKISRKEYTYIWDEYNAIKKRKAKTQLMDKLDGDNNEQTEYCGNR